MGGPLIIPHLPSTPTSRREGDRGSRRLALAALVPYAPGTTPSQRFRIEQWTPYLAQDGITVRLLPFADPVLTTLLQAPGHVTRKAWSIALAFLRRAQTVARLRSDDAVLIHRAACLAGPPLLERGMVRLGLPILYDFDDAIFLLHAASANRRLAWLKFPGKTATICRISDHVVVGNSYLADYARGHNPHVTVVPSSIDTDRYRPRPRDSSPRRVVVGWMGTSTSQTHLEMFGPMLGALARSRDVEIRVVSNRRPDLPGVPVLWRPWSAGTEVDEVAEFDVGIMPMPDDEWAMGKCALKALQYMAMGVSTIASAVGANREVIAHGRSGLLASSNGEWLAGLQALVDDPGLRGRLGRAARETVEAGYSMRSSVSLLAPVVHEVVRRRREPE